MDYLLPQNAKFERGIFGSVQQRSHALALRGCYELRIINMDISEFFGFLISLAAIIFLFFKQSSDARKRKAKPQATLTHIRELDKHLSTPVRHSKTQNIPPKSQKIPKKEKPPQPIQPPLQRKVQISKNTPLKRFDHLTVRQRLIVSHEILEAPLALRKNNKPPN